MLWTSLIDSAERRDPATGLWTRRYLEACAEDAMSEAKLSGRQVAVVSLTASTSKSAARLQDLLQTGLNRNERAARVGFGRFAVVVIHVTQDAVWDLVERVQRTILTPVDVSVATFPDDGVSFAQLLDRTEWTERAAA